MLSVPTTLQVTDWLGVCEGVGWTLGVAEGVSNWLCDAVCVWLGDPLGDGVVDNVGAPLCVGDAVWLGVGEQTVLRPTRSMPR